MVICIILVLDRCVISEQLYSDQLTVGWLFVSTLSVMDKIRRHRERYCEKLLKVSISSVVDRVFKGQKILQKLQGLKRFQS